MQRFFPVLVLVVVASCSSDRAQARSVATEAESQGAFNNRLALTETLVQCARLTWSSTEKPLEVKLAVDGDGMPVAMTVNGDKLLCPADNPNSTYLMERGGGGSFGQMPRQAWIVEVWCTPGLSEESSGGCAHGAQYVDVDHVATAGTTPRKAAATTTLKTAGRAPVAIRYQARRLGTDFLQGEPFRIDDQLKALDAVVTLCMHARQPDVQVSHSSDFQLQVSIATGPLAVGAPYLVSGGEPRALVDAIMPCISELTPAEVHASVPVRVRYNLVTEKAEKKPGLYVQKWEVTVLRELVEAGVESNARRAFEKELAAALKACFAERPAEVRGVTTRWVQLPPLTFHGTVDAVRKERVHLLELSVDAPPAAQAQAQCAVAAMPVEKGSTQARAEWQIVVDLAPSDELLQ